MVIDSFAVCAVVPSCWNHTLAQFILLRRSSEYYPFKRYQVPVGHPVSFKAFNSSSYPLMYPKLWTYYSLRMDECEYLLKRNRRPESCVSNGRKYPNWQADCCRSVCTSVRCLSLHLCSSVGHSHFGESRENCWFEVRNGGDILGVFLSTVKPVSSGNSPQRKPVSSGKRFTVPRLQPQIDVWSGTCLL